MNDLKNYNLPPVFNGITADLKAISFCITNIK